MSADTLTDARANALRLLAEGPCMTSNRTERFASPNAVGAIGSIHEHAEHRLRLSGYVERADRWTVTITPAGREALAAHEDGTNR